ncbi:hypothetical protein L7F22_022254 [Adiantum nelumboides]|nr:hypothetical protein [Adiantum nelumboides]
MVVTSPRRNGAGDLNRHAYHIRKLCKHGHLDEAFKVVDSMEKHNLLVSRDIIYSLLQGCNGVKDLSHARRVHDLMRKYGLSSVAALGDHLIRLFSTCGSLCEANEAFFGILNPSVFSWNSLIAAHAKLADPLKALQLFEKMQLANVVPDRVTFVCMCHASGCAKAWRPGMYMHHQAIRQAYESNLVLGNSLIDMYANCGCLAEARNLFDTQVEKDLVTWTVIISGYAAQGHGLPALRLYSKALSDVLKPNKAMILSAIKACVSEGTLNEGKLLHVEALEDGLEADVIIMSSLVDMYAKLGCLAEAEKVFGALCARDVVSWSAMVDGYAQSDRPYPALQVFARMLQSGVQPNETTFLGILRASSTLGMTESLRFVHSHIIEVGIEINTVIGSALVDTYGNCKVLDDAYSVFTRLLNKSLVSWGAAISGFLECGKASRALELFNELLLEGIEPNSIVCLCVLKACSNIEAMEEGLLIHVLIVQMGFESNKAIENSLVDLYAKHGDLNGARAVFNHLCKPDAVSFGALIAGYSVQGWNTLALDLYDEMRKQGVSPDRPTFLSLLKACSTIGAVGQGHLLHEQIVFNGLDSASFVKNALVNMYAKTGKLDEAHQVVGSRSNYDEVSCASIMGGYKYQGDLSYILELLKEMHRANCHFDNAMLACILTACNRAGLLKEGYELFTSISERHALIPTQEHYSSTIDLLGRAGQLQVAKDVSITMPMPPDLITQTSLFGSSKSYNNLEQCRQYFEISVE